MFIKMVWKNKILKVSTLPQVVDFDIFFFVQAQWSEKSTFKFLFVVVCAEKAQISVQLWDL